jgi:hypothetical protein
VVPFNSVVVSAPRHKNAHSFGGRMPGTITVSADDGCLRPKVDGWKTMIDSIFLDIIPLPPFSLRRIYRINCSNEGESGSIATVPFENPIFRGH